MSQKKTAQRARHDAQEEENGKKVVKWIFGILIALAVLFICLGSMMG